MGLDPDLEEVEWLRGGWVELRVGDAGACAHELDFPGLELAGVSHGVHMGEGAGEDVAEDFHIVVRVGGEAAAGGDFVLVDDA